MTTTDRLMSVVRRSAPCCGFRLRCPRDSVSSLPHSTMIGAPGTTVLPARASSPRVSDFRYPALALATVFGVGYVPVAPGTFGSAAGLLLWWALPHSNVVLAATALVLFAAGSWSGTIAERHFNSTDPGYVVIEE